jgi:hypothetical protein
MSTCTRSPLFEPDVSDEFDRMIGAVARSIEGEANRLVNLQHDVFDDAIGSAGALASLRKKLKVPMPCNAAEFGRRLRAAPFRRLEDDFGLLALHAMRNGLSGPEIWELAGQRLLVSFTVADDRRLVQLRRMELAFADGAHGHYLLGSSRHDGFVRSGGVVQLAGDEAPDGSKGMSYQVDPSFWDALIDCLTGLFRKIADALASKGLIPDAIDDVDEAIDDINDELEDLDEDIDELDDEIEDAENEHDAEDSRDERREKRNRRRALRRALGDLKEAREKLEDAARMQGGASP